MKETNTPSQHAIGSALQECSETKCINCFAIHGCVHGGNTPMPSAGQPTPTLAFSAYMPEELMRA